MSVVLTTSQPSLPPTDPPAPSGSLVLRSHLSAGRGSSWLLPPGSPPCLHVPHSSARSAQFLCDAQGCPPPSALSLHTQKPRSPSPSWPARPIGTLAPCILNPQLVPPASRGWRRRETGGYRKILFNWSSTSLPGKRGRPALASSGGKRAEQGLTHAEPLIPTAPSVPHPQGPHALPQRGPSKPYLSTRTGEKVPLQTPQCVTCKDAAG